jgi:hypothetical protein
MGTTPNDKRSQNRVTISRGGETPARKVDPETGATDRSFAQPNPAVEHPTPTPKAHASEADARKALAENSTKGRSYEDVPTDGDDSQD